MRKKAFSREMEDKLVEILSNKNHTFSEKALARLFNVSARTIKSTGERLGFKITGRSNYIRRDWSDEEILFLKENYKFGYKYVAEKLKRKLNSVQGKARNLGIKMTHEEKSIINIESFVERDKNRKIPEEQFLNIIKPEVAYFLGYFWADGSITKRNYSLAMNLAKADMDKIKPIFDRLGEWGHTEYIHKERKPISIIYCASKPLYMFFVENDYLRKSFVRQDKILSKIPEHLKHYWWRGYFDGDGYYHASKTGSYQMGFCGDYKQDWSYTKELFDKLSISGKLVLQDKGAKGRNSTYRIYNKDGVFKLSEYIYQNYENDKIGLERKYNSLLFLKSRSIDRSLENSRKRVGKSTLIRLVTNNRGIYKRDGKFKVRIANFNIGTFFDETAAINAYNYYAGIRYGNYFNPCPVLQQMSKEDFLKYRSTREERKVSLDELEKQFYQYSVDMGYRESKIEIA